MSIATWPHYPTTSPNPRPQRRLSQLVGLGWRGELILYIALANHSLYKASGEPSQSVAKSAINGRASIILLAYFAPTCYGGTWTFQTIPMRYASE